MSTAIELSALGALIRRSALVESYQNTQILLERYVKELERAVHSSPAERSQLESQAFALFEWTSELTMISRAELLESVSQLQQLARYHSALG